MNRCISSSVVIFSILLLLGVVSITHAQPADNLLQVDNIFDTLFVDLKVNGSDGPVNVAVGERITISWESDGAKRCKGNWSKNDLRLNGKISGKLSRSLIGSVTVRMACIDADGNREDDSVVLKITNPVTPPPPPPPPSPDQPIIISSCGEITKSGKYILDKDITSVSGVSCLNIHDISDVYIDCDKHSITGLNNTYGSLSPVYVKNVDNFSITSCTINTDGYTPLVIEDSANGAINNNTIGKYYVNVLNSSGLTIKNNVFNSTYQQKYTNGSVIANNLFNPFVGLFPGGTSNYNPAGVIVSNFGSNTKILNNTIDGKAKGILSDQTGSDDGIIINDEKNDVIQDNRIINNYDCGIETGGFISNTVISGNSISNAGFCGIGGWYWNSWKGNIVSDNVVNDAPALFQLFRLYGFRPQGWDDYKKAPADEQNVYFKDNIFANNKFIPRTSTRNNNFTYPSSAVNLRPPQVPSAAKGEILPTQDQMLVSNNVFKGNDFSSTVPAPDFYPLSEMIVDGGGNICGKISDVNYPLKCGQ